MLRRFALILPAAACLSLQACWVPQVVSGVRPQIFPSAAASVTPFADVTLEGKLVALSTRLVAISKRTSGLLSLSSNLAAHRQAIENQTYYSAKAASGNFSGWVYANGGYTTYDSQSGARYSLSLIDGQSKPASFDVLGQGSYGQTPQQANVFPSDIHRYQLQLQLPDPLASDSLGVSLTGVWPNQIPLRDVFNTTLSGSGEVNGTGVFKHLDLRIDGKTSSDGTLTEGQLGFTTEIDGHVYNGFGTLDARGFDHDVTIEQNGIAVAVIKPSDKRWDVLINGRISASAD